MGSFVLGRVVYVWFTADLGGCPSTVNGRFVVVAPSGDASRDRRNAVRAARKARDLA